MAEIETSWSKENDVDDYVKDKLKNLGLIKGKDFFEKDGSDYLKDALKGYSKTDKKSGVGVPDFVLEKYTYTDHHESYPCPVFIESKFSLTKLEALNGDVLKTDEKSIKNYAINGALHYARGAIASGKYRQAFAIGIAGDNKENVKIKVILVQGSANEAYLFAPLHSLDFLKNQETFEKFYHTCTLTEERKHQILIRTSLDLQEHAKKLNKLMHNHNIIAGTRVIYVSGMLLSMQNIDTERGLIPSDLKGSSLNNQRDGILIYNRIEELLKTKITEQNKLNLVRHAFQEICKDPDRDKSKSLDPLVSKAIEKDASLNKQIFTYIYNNIYSKMEGFNFSSYVDIMGECYSEFLKYALGDGKELGIVLTPPYITKMMAEILEINHESKVMDLAMGSAGFLIASMTLMSDQVKKTFIEDSKDYQEKINHIKQHQLLGVEIEPSMFALATTNMILRGDGSCKIHKGDSLDGTLNTIIKDFQADRLLLNPPFSHSENGMPFIKLGLDNMPKHSLGAIIIQDSAGSGKAIKTNKEILSRHTLKASIKMPMDLFVPMAGVQTSIYVFESGVPHDYDKIVKFIDFRNDGYKRTDRGLKEIDSPTERYSDVVQIYKNGFSAKLKASWDLKSVYIEDFINDSGSDWNFDTHQKIDTKPNLCDFKKTIADYLSWEVSNILKDRGKILGKPQALVCLEETFKANGGDWREYKTKDLFEIVSSRRIFHKNELKRQKAFFSEEKSGTYPYVVRSAINNGIVGYIKEDQEFLNPANTLSFAQDTFSVFYQEKPYFTGNNVKILIPKNWKLNRAIGLFISAVYQKVLSDFTWGKSSTIETIKEYSISLPTINDQIAFDYIEAYIQELEQERIQELEAYLQASGLKDTTLTQNEQIALHTFLDTDYNSGGGDNSSLTVCWKEYKIGELFDIHPTKAYKLTNSGLFTENGKNSVVTNSSCNNGITGYTNLDNTEDGNIITFSDTASHDAIFYQDKPFVGYSHVQGMYPKGEYKDSWGKHSYLFFLSLFKKTAYYMNFNYGNKFNRNIAKEISIKLPTINDQIAFDFMQDLMTALSKQVVHALNAYTSLKIQTAKEVINK